MTTDIQTMRCLSDILSDVEAGMVPCDYGAPFDPDNPEHLRLFFDATMSAMNGSPGAHVRVTDAAERYAGLVDAAGGSPATHGDDPTPRVVDFGEWRAVHLVRLSPEGAPVWASDTPADVSWRGESDLPGHEAIRQIVKAMSLPAIRSDQILQWG